MRLFVKPRLFVKQRTFMKHSLLNFILLASFAIQAQPANNGARPMPGANTNSGSLPSPGAPRPSLDIDDGEQPLTGGSNAGSTPPGGGAVGANPNIIKTPGLPPRVRDPNAPQSQAPGEEQLAPQLKIGDYVELDDSIKNEMYGTIDFPNADLRDIIKAIAKLTGKNFILDRKIEGRKVTIVSPQPVTKQEAYNAFLSALYMNDFALVSMGKFLKIVEAKSALQSNIRVFVGDYAPASEEIVTLLYPLKHLNAEEIQRFLVDLVPRQGRVSYYPSTNTLVMTDAGLNLRRIISILKAIDVPGHEDQLENIPIVYANAKAISGLVDDILNAQQGRGGPRPGGMGGARKTRGGGIITKIIADDRTNSLVVLANGRGIEELKQLIAKLDTPNAAGGGNIHIYYCKNAVADELATTINALISGAQSNRPQGSQGPINMPPQGLPSFAAPGLANAPAGGGGVKLEGNIKVTSDKSTNSLVIVASGSDYSALKTILRKLDIPRRQVYVEGTIMEINVTDTKSINAGVNIAGPNTPQMGGFIPTTASTGTDLLSMVSTPASINGLLAGFQTGQTYPVNVGGKEFHISTVTALLKAIVDSDQGQILHQPQILTTDNKEGSIKVETKVPYLTQTVSATAAGAVTANTPQKESINMLLKITPQLGESTDLIKLKVEQEISDFQSRDFGTAGKIPEVTTRTANTEVVVRNGDTIAVGGLQRTLSSDSRSKFPILGDIPVLGFFFRGMSSNVSRKNLILFLKPRIISEYNDIIKITEEKLNKREEMVDKYGETSDRTKKEAKELREETQVNLAKAAPKSWGFKPKAGKEDESFDEPEDKEDDEGSSNKKSAEGKSSDQAMNKGNEAKKSDASAYMSEDAFGTGAPPALNNEGGPTILTPPSGLPQPSVR